MALFSTGETPDAHRLSRSEFRRVAEQLIANSSLGVRTPGEAAEEAKDENNQSSAEMVKSMAKIALKLDNALNSFSVPVVIIGMCWIFYILYVIMYSAIPEYREQWTPMGIMMTTLSGIFLLIMALGMIWARSVFNSILYNVQFPRLLVR